MGVCVEGGGGGLCLVSLGFVWGVAVNNPFPDWFVVF